MNEVKIKRKNYLHEKYIYLTALSATLASIGALEIMNLTLIPSSSFKISPPRNSASLLVQVIDVLFLSAYSEILLDMTLSSPMYSIGSASSTYSPLLSRILYHLSPPSPHA